MLDLLEVLWEYYNIILKSFLKDFIAFELERILVIL